MISSDPRLPVGRHPLAGGGMSLTIIASLFVYSCELLLLCRFIQFQGWILL